MNFCTAASL